MLPVPHVTDIEVVADLFCFLLSFLLFGYAMFMQKRDRQSTGTMGVWRTGTLDICSWRCEEIVKKSRIAPLNAIIIIIIVIMLRDFESMYRDFGQIYRDFGYVYRDF